LELNFKKYLISKIIKFQKIFQGVTISNEVVAPYFFHAPKLAPMIVDDDGRTTMAGQPQQDDDGN
jgi:hypothetical protein